MESVIKAESDGQILTQTSPVASKCRGWVNKTRFLLSPHKSAELMPLLSGSLGPINLDDDQKKWLENYFNIVWIILLFDFLNTHLQWGLLGFTLTRWRELWTGCCKVHIARLHCREQRKCAIRKSVHKSSWLDRKSALTRKSGSSIGKGSVF